MIKNNIILTGSEGYIGNYLKKILPVDKMIDLKLQSDIREKTLNLNCDTLIHLAAFVQVGESIKEPKKYYDNNINGTINLLNKFKGNHFIFASTGAASKELTSPYAISKKVCEDIVQEHCTKHNINYTIFRFYNVIGGNPTNPDGLFYALKNAVKTNVFNLYGTNYNTPDKTAIKDYVHIDEICESIKSCVNNPSNSIESLGHGRGYSVKQIIEIFKKVNKVNFKVICCDSRPGDLQCNVLDNVSKYMVSKYSVEEMFKL